MVIKNFLHLQIIIIIFALLYVLNINVNSVNAKKDKNYYIENETLLNWTSAYDACANMSMNLVSIRSSEDFDFLKTIIQQKFGRIDPYWLGAYRTGGVYRWLPKGDQIKQFYWHEGEPNDKTGKENCIHTWHEHFDWNDNDCERELPFICEGEAE